MPQLETSDDVIAFWQDAGFSKWFTKDEVFDATFRESCLTLHQRAATGQLDAWQSTANGALALILLFDQFPRNAFRNTAQMFATDAMARDYAARALAQGFDNQVQPALRMFFYLPFEHSENLDDQHRSVALHEAIDFKEYAVQHRDIIQRFGRFPHRNAVLGRPSTAAELAYLEAGGFAG
ncbi:MAG: DUF924 domain-containing protein [Myxococcales bacterium]|nr:DUF924 domain-containing protein [Myxococcales bacterium]